MRLAGVGLLLLSGVTLAAQALPRIPPASAAPAAPAPLRGTISGRVTDAATGDPIRHARVSVSSSAGTVPSTLTDGDGQYSAAELPGGHATVSVDKPGYVRRRIGTEVPAARTGVRVDVALFRGGIISGTVVTDRGEPLVDASVAVDRLVDTNGKTRTAPVAFVQTDDLGAFRFAGLSAGTYVLDADSTVMRTLDESAPGDHVSIESRFPPGYSRLVYYPGVRELIDAQRITLQPGDDTSGLTFVAPEAPRPPPPPPPPPRRDIDRAAGSASATLQGRVFRPSGTPASGARIAVVGIDAGRPVAAAVADAQGRFSVVIPDPESDTFRVTANLEAFGPRSYGQDAQAPRGAVLRVRAGEVRERLDMTFVKPSVISGRILDDLGEPVEGAAVQTAMVRYVNGRRQLMSGAGFRRTDDQGRYRLWGLRPGTFAVSATVGQVVYTDAAAEYPGFGRTYFPGTPSSAEAGFVRVGAAQEVTDINFSLVRARSYRISGIALNAAGDPVNGGVALLPTQRSGANTSQQFGARIERDGRFEFGGVAPGDYVVQVVRNHSNTGNEGEFAFQFVRIVNSDAGGLLLRASTGSSIRGRLTLIGAAPDAFDAATVELVAVPADLDRAPRIGGPAARADIREDRSFSLRGISGPRRLQVRRAPAGWMMKSVTAGGIDITDRVIEFGRDTQSLDDVEVLLTDQITQIAGAIGERRGLAPSDISVLAFATSRDAWYLGTRYFQSATPKSDGSFSVTGLPPGEYFVMAVETPQDTGEWQDPDVLERLSSRATRVRIVDREHATMTLVVRR